MAERVQWLHGAPPYLDHIAVVIDASQRRHRMGLAAWNSTSDCFCITWQPSGAEERHTELTWPVQYRYCYLDTQQDEHRTPWVPVQDGDDG